MFERWVVRGIGLAGALLFAPLAASGQGTTSPAANPADVASIDAIVAAVYDVISGPAGEARDWDRFRSLFIPDARLVPTGPRPDGGVGHQVLSPDDYVTRVGPQFEERGFFEREIGRVAERYGPVVHFMSAYEARFTSEDQPTPDMRGVNSFQLLFDGTRWWVVTIFWSAETPDNPIPDRFIG